MSKTKVRRERGRLRLVVIKSMTKARMKRRLVKLESKTKVRRKRTR